MYHNAIFVSSRAQMPLQEHWAIIKFGSIHIPGDERSRTNPGHGYPDRYESVVNYEAYLNRDDWVAAIQELEKCSYHKNYHAVKVSAPATITAKIEVN